MSHEIIEYGYRDGHDPDAESIWAAYEANGSLRQTAKQLEIPYSRVRRVLTADPVRLNDIRLARSEETIRRWDEKESMAATMTSRLMDNVSRVIEHIEECEQEGRPYTKLIDARLSFKGMDSGIVYMTPWQARVWLMDTKQLEAMSKVGLNAAKTAEGQRTAILAGVLGPGVAQKTGDPSASSDEEILMELTRLEESGAKIPPSIRQWVESRKT